MADMSLENLVTSKPFQFLVGTEKKEFIMHSNLVAKMSSPFDALINGSLKEAKEGVAHLSEVDEATFTRFFQFAYRGDYKVAELNVALPNICEDPQHKTSADSPQSLNYCERCKCSKCVRTRRGKLTGRGFWDNEVPENCSTCGWPDCRCPTTQAIENGRGGLRNHGTNESKVSGLWKSFIDESGFRTSMLEVLDIDDPGRCWSDIFLAHARVYIFADCYDIDSLAELSKTKLHRALVIFELTPDGIDHITMLVDYICRNTRDDDKLRTLLCRYCACNIQQLSPNDKFSALLAEMGDFSSAVIKQLLGRLS